LHFKEKIMGETSKTINLGILAHVDAGKTSITEQLLFKSGAIRSAGSVDKGTTQTDSLRIEKERGISVRSASVSFIWNDIQVNVIDTPGHIDFSAEVERVLPAMDAAVLVVSASEGIQSHTATLWEALKALKIPVLLFVNKIDRDGVDLIRLKKELNEKVGSSLVFLQKVENEGSGEAIPVALIASSGLDLASAELAEQIIAEDDQLLEAYLNGEKPSDDVLIKTLRKKFIGRVFFPVLFGSAKLDRGIDSLLEWITALMPIAAGTADNAFSGIVFKVEHDDKNGRVAMVRVFEGTIGNRDSVFVSGLNAQAKLSQIKKIQGQKQQDVSLLEAGDIGAVYGLAGVRPGDWLGESKAEKRPVNLNASLLTVQVSPEKEEDYPALVSAMQVLSDEDPALDLLWLKDERALHIKIMGVIQLEVLQAILLERFMLSVSFSQPQVIYKETPVAAGEGYDAYTMPKPCWAVVRFRIEPGEVGSGVQYTSEVGVNDIAAKYQHEIEKALPSALSQGIKGWEVTDLKITLIAGEDHVMHSRPGDFKIATHLALMSGLQHIGTKLLEPVLSYTIHAPEVYLGKIISSLLEMRASFDSPVIHAETCMITGKVPLATSVDYSIQLLSLTGGKGKFISRFAAYEPCPEGEGKSIPYRGVSPLDRSKFILKARKALQ